tara:strand:+ start:126866 stop:128371 length:1506 start_codon:yes stop_codon:yes gene_type:complete
MSIRTRFRKSIQLLIAIIAAIVIAIVVNDRKHVSRQIAVEPADAIAIDPTHALERFQRAIQIETVSAANPARVQKTTFLEFASFLKDAFPTIHAEPISRMAGDDWDDPSNLTLLYQWPGSDPKLDPILLMAHFDVVPVDAETREKWTHAPFSGEIDQDFVWGRGTLDAKNSALAMMEAIAHLLQENFDPRRTVYLSFGHDEEVGGQRGNARVADWMTSQGVRLQFVLDEGGCIFRDFPGMDRHVALIGIAEKGFANIRLTATLQDGGGHASMPPTQTAIEVLAAAIDRLNHTPLPRRIGQAGQLMLDYLGPEMKWPNRTVIANRWLFTPLIRRQLGATESGNAMLRTTIAPTLIRGGVKENVLPSQATATLNCRLLPGDRLSMVVDHIRHAIDDSRITIEVDDSAREASRISDTNCTEFSVLHRSLQAIYPDVVVAPFVLVGGTDSYHFQDIAKNIYRIIPARLDANDLKRIHGVDERIATSDYLDLIRFYVRLIRKSAAG